MTLRLYYAPGACSFVPHAMLEIAGVPFEPMPVRLHKGEQTSPAYLALNPRGQVPVLVDGDDVITQIMAIATYIDGKYAGGRFLPKEPLARAKFVERLAWFNNTVHPTFTHIFRPGNFSGETANHAEMQAFATAKYKTQLAEIDAMCAKATPWLAGAEIGPLDLYAVVLMRWGGFAGIDPKTWPHLWPHANKVVQHPGVAKAVAREKLELDVKPLKS
jgi:glutathione S-transferase